MSTKTTLAVAAFALISAGSAFAAEGTQDFNDVQKLSATSRAAVVAEIAQAPALTIGDASVAPKAASMLQRVRVQAEAKEAQRLGLTPSGELLPQPTIEQLEQVRTAGDRAVATIVAKQR